MNAGLRAFPGLPRSRADRIRYFENRIRAREASDPTTPYKKLYAQNNPADFRRFEPTPIGLAEFHERVRCAYVLRAWCAQQIGWRNEVKVNLDRALASKRIAASWRKEGR